MPFLTSDRNHFVASRVQREPGGKPASGAFAAEHQPSGFFIGILQKGLHPKDFPECFVIFFTESDIFHEFKPIYHVERSIVETGLPFNDEQHIIYVNGQNKEDTPLGQLVHDLWQADPANIINPKLRNAVAHYKTTKEGQQRMCRSLEKMRNETLEIAATEMIERLLSKGKTPDEIIDLCEYPKELVYEVAESLLEKA